MSNDLWTAAPYPTSADQQTPAALARHLTLSTFHLMLDLPRLHKEWESAGLPRLGALRDAYVHACSAISAQYGLILMLRREAGLTVDEPVIAEVYQPYEGWFEYVDSDIDTWLEECGIDTDSAAIAYAASKEPANV